MKFIIIGLALLACALADQKLKKAKVVLIPDAKNGAKDIAGTIYFTETSDKSVKVSGTISKITKGLHGFHVHEKDDIKASCDGAGGHFNPDNKQHGDRLAAERHVGDLGNVDAKDNGEATIDLEDKVIALNGKNNIIGRTLVLHELADDLGKGGNTASLANGNAGKRIACGIIVEDNAVKAKVVLKSDPQSAQKDIEATIFFTLTDDNNVRVNGTISKINEGLHGFHVHEKADIDESCTGAGAHFNPENKNHGAPTDADRHVGDLGNVEANKSGIAVVDINDAVIALSGPRGIIGRAVVLHELEDDLGKGGFDDSLTTGHAGSRIACGVIVEVNGGNMLSMSVFVAVLTGFVTFLVNTV